MATFLMFGKYSLDSLREISAERTNRALALIKKHGGEYKAGYALLGDKDLLLIVELPSSEQAMKVSIALTKLLGVAFSTTPAVSIEAFDKMMMEG